MFKKFTDNTKNYWITADTHYWHKNIVKGVSNWNDKSGCRDFSTMSEHNNTIVDNINKYVNPDDVLIHLGDWSFSGIDKIWEFRRRLNVEEIHLLLGNHDHHIEGNKVLPNCTTRHFPQGSGPIFDLDKQEFLSVCAQNLFTSVSHVGVFQIHGLKLFCSHYSHRVWNNSHKGRVHLYGHSHGTIPDFGRSMDVGVDTAFKLMGEYRPLKFQEIQKIMTKKEVAFVDHHNLNTN